MVVIKKKSWPSEFGLILNGKKKFDVRLDDFDINKGDILVLEEFDPEKGEYTGRKIEKKVDYVLRTKEAKYWDKKDIDEKGFVVISLGEVE